MLRLEPRAQPSKLWRYASPLLALAITVVLGVILFVALGKDPVRGLQVFFWEPIKSVYALSELIVKATPLLLIALGLAVCFRSNVWNIGAEGQYILGAIAASGLLPFERRHYEAVLSGNSASAKASLRGFSLAFERVSLQREQAQYVEKVLSPAAPKASLAFSLPTQVAQQFPKQTHELLALAFDRLVQYQNENYN